jgi:hypothetical protein
MVWHERLDAPGPAAVTRFFRKTARNSVRVERDCDASELGRERHVATLAFRLGRNSLDTRPVRTLRGRPLRIPRAGRCSGSIRPSNVAR